MKTTISHLNALPSAAFVEQLSTIFEHSPWVAEKTAASRPYANTEALHYAMIQIVDAAGEGAHLKLLNAHPDLVGKTLLTAESASEQAAAGLTHLSEQEVEKFRAYNQAYREKFGFPFIICARSHKKESILAAFPKRLAQNRTSEIATALEEISKIARLRLNELLS